jgi:hypothetical protein
VEGGGYEWRAAAVNPATYRFLRECPEWASEFMIDPELGPVMTTAATVAFVNWASEKGLCNPEKAARLRKALLEKAEEWRRA